MMFKLPVSLSAVALAALAFGPPAASAAEETPVHGGTLDFVVGSNPPSYDGHVESTFGMIHPIRPMYSLLLRVNPDNPMSPTDIICDLCEGKWEVSPDGKAYTFNIRKNVKFHDGTPLTSADIKATLDKIIFPPENIVSTRKSWYGEVAEVEAPEPYKLVVKLKRPLPAIIPALASPFNFVYSKKDLDTHGYTWHKTHINGTGAFMFVQAQPGAFIEAKRNPNFYIEGRPYLDGYKAIQAPKMSVRLQAIRGNRAAAEFRGFPPKAAEDLIKAMGKLVTVQRGDVNNLMGVVPNQKKKAFQDPRVRQALAYALDRWGSIKYLQEIAIVKTVGGLFFPNHPLAASKKELQKLPGYTPNIKKAREKARQLLKEAGQEHLKLTLWNRAVDQPYKIIGTWHVDEWRKVGIEADQRVVPSGPYYAGLTKSRDFDVSIDFNGQTIVNPTLDVSKWTCGSGYNYSSCTDKKTDELYQAMLYETDPKKQYEKARIYENYILGEQADWIPSFWWHRIVVNRSFVKGWKIGPSHLLNQALDTVWIDPKLK
jgi:peptide/nickel transport system substrate-binding protein